MSDVISDEIAMKKLRAVLAAHDSENVFWPAKNVEFAVNILRKARGSVPTIDEVAIEIGEERAHTMLPMIIESRKFDNAELGYRSPCHYCGSGDELVHHDFALMAVEKASRKWGETAASIALSAALFPVLGGGVVQLPGKSFHGAAIHLRLVVCKSCRKKNSNLFGAFVINQQKAATHPLWSHLITAGFTKFIEKESMPDDFKYRADMKL
jgi:hypothetical protein